MTRFDPLAPLYAQVRQTLEERIGSGALQEGDFLPPEPQLCAELGVSRITLRRAVGELCEAGLLVRQQGRGTVVARRKVPLTLVSLSGFADAFDVPGRALRHVILEAAPEAADPPAEAILGAAPLARLLRLITLDGRALTLETLLFDPERLPGVFGPVARGASFFQTLRQTGGPAPEAAERLINVGFAQSAERRHLNIPQSQPVFRIDKTILDANGTALAVSRLVTPANQVTYSLRS